MKILHTSDWHLGQYFMMKTRETEHLAFLDWLIELVNKEKIDAVLVAGDIFDSSSPPSYARKLYSDFIVKLQTSYCKQLIIVSGNHDSVAVLNESKSLLNALNVSVLAGLSDNISEHLITLKNSQGEDAALVCALPFLRAQDVMTSEHGISAEQKKMNLQQGIQNVYQSLYQLAKQKDPTLPIFATAHLTSVGCSVSESVRDIYIGTLTAFPAQLFPDFDYIALGHLHRAQKVQKSETIRYSGSPISLSFDESKHSKQVLIVDSSNKPLQVSSIAIPCFQSLRVIEGNLQQVIEQINAIKDEDQTQSVWVEVKLKQAHYQSDLQEQLNELIEGSAIEILKVSSPQVSEASQWVEQQGETLETLTPVQLFEHRLSSEENLSDQQQQQLTLLYKQVLADVEHQS
ncbi:MAG: exonuclease subunit SbcD [Psychromonas sp.]